MAFSSAHQKSIGVDDPQRLGETAQFGQSTALSSWHTRVFWINISGRAGIDTFKLTIYATDIGALPTLLLAVERPDIARTIIVGDFAPFNRLQFMYASLQGLKAGPAMDQIRASKNSNRDEILAPSREACPRKRILTLQFKDDMLQAWTHGAMTVVDAF